MQTQTAVKQPNTLSAANATAAPRAQLPCAHMPGKEVLVCVAAHCNVLGVVHEVGFDQEGHTSYAVLMDANRAEPWLMGGVPSWRVSSVPADYNGHSSASITG